MVDDGVPGGPTTARRAGSARRESTADSSRTTFKERHEAALQPLVHHGRAVLEAVEPLNATGTVRLSFRVADDLRFDFEPGQFVSIRFEDAAGRTMRRPYCILSPPDGSGRFDLLVRVVGGPVSNRLLSLRPGEAISYRGPLGRGMRLLDADRELVILATGVGIAPVYSYLRDVEAAGDGRRIHVYWGLRTADDLCLLDELDELTAANDRVRVDITLSQPPPGWAGLRGRITESVPPLLATLGDKEFYLAGNGAMIQEMTTALSDLGVARRFIHEEAYFNSRHVPRADVMAEIRSRFVARDLFSPFAHADAGLFLHDETAEPVSGNVDPNAHSDVGKHIRPLSRRRPDDEPRPMWGL
jgi:NAD(P)H-flavin reductase